MKRRVLSFVCVLALTLSLLPTAALADTPDFSLGLEVTATVGETEEVRDLGVLRAGDIVTARVILPAQCKLSAVQAKLLFDKEKFEVTTKTEDGETFGNASTELPEYSTAGKRGWTATQITDYSEANSAGYVAITSTGQVKSGNSTKPGNVTNETELAILIVEFKVKDNSGVGTASPAFSIASNLAGESNVRFAYENETNQTVAYTVGLPAPVSATVVQELGNVTLSGSVTAPAKNVTDTSALTGEHVTANVSWSPALTDNKFAANTPYTATVTVTPSDGYLFTDSSTVTLDGWSFTKSGNSFVASKQYEKTADRELTGIEIKTNPSAMNYQHGDALNKAGLALTATYDDATTAEINGEDSSVTITYSNGTSLSKDDTSVTINYGGKTATLSGLTVSGKTASADSYQLTGLPTDNTYTGSVLSVGVEKNPSATDAGDVNGTLTFIYSADGEAAYTSVNEVKNAGHYKVTFNTSAGTAYEAGAGLELRFTIAPKSITGADIMLDTAPTYDGTAKNVTISAVKVDELTLTTDDYEITSGNSATNVENTALIITGKGNFTGEATKAWSLTAKSVDASMIAEIPSASYTGDQITPTPEVNDGEKELTSGTDFTYSYSNNQYVGTATVTVTGKGNYQGAANKGFAITAVEDPAVITTTANVTKGGNTLDLNSLVTGAKGDVSFAITDDANGCTIDANGVLTSGATTGNVTVTVTVEAKDENGDNVNEYTGKSGSIAVTVTDKTTAALAGGVTQQGCTFGDTLSAPTYTEPDGTQSTTVSYTGTLRKDGTSYSSAAKPIEAGTYKVTVTCETATHIYSATSADFTIAPKSITGATVTLGTSLTYSGSEQTQNVSEVKLGDTTLGTADYTLSDNTVTKAGSYNLTVTGTGNYTDSVQQAFTVAKKSITPNVEVTGTYTYTGSAIKPTVTVKAGNTPLAETDYALEYSNNTDAGEATVTVKATANGNYSFTDTEKKFTIAQADYSGTKTANASAKYGAAGELDLNNVLNPTAGWRFGAASVTRGNDVFAADSVKVADGKLSFQFVNDSSKVNSTATVKIPVTSTNYNNFDLEVTLTVLAKTAQTLSADSLNKTYGDTFTASVSGAQTQVTYSVKSGSESLLKYENGRFTAIGVGTATIVATAAENEEYASATKEITVTIDKRTLTVKAADKSAYIGEKLPELTYEVTGLVGNDKLTTVPTLKLLHDANVDPMKQAGTYVIGFETEPAASANYELSAQTGTLTVSARPSYVGPTGNAVSVDRTENGKISVSPSYAAKGATVTITVTPDKDQELKSLEVIDQNGNSLPLTDLGNGKFSFVMPEGKVTIKSEFGEANAFVNPYDDVKPGDWYYSAVEYVTVNGLMNGTGKGFEPNLATSRAMIWTILARMSDVNTASGGEWYAVAQQWAIANGVSDGTMPNGTITREQLAAMLYRYAVSKGMVKGPATADLSVFADANSVSSYAVEAMQWAVSTGLIGGMDGKLNPQGSATRAQVATMLMRFAELAK